MRRATLTASVIGAIALALLCLPAGAAADLAPTVTLDSPGSTPLLTPTPTLSGTAGTRPGIDSTAVDVLVYAGTDTTPPALTDLTTSPDRTSGGFSVQVSPGLADGQYTAVAEQNSVAGTTSKSAPQTFRIKTNAPAVTLDQPTTGASTANAQPQFSGSAGEALGDAGQVQLTLYAGGSTGGQLLGSTKIARTGPGWSARWPVPLGAGQYTAQATQTDDAGHTGSSAAHTFTVIFPRGVIGSSVRLSRSGRLTLPVTCTAPAGATCAGSVLILTVARFRPVRGGPSGRLALLFAHVEIPAGQTAVLGHQLKRSTVRALRHAGRVRVRVDTAFVAPGATPTSESQLRRLRRG